MCVIRMLKFDSAMLEYLQNLNYLFGPIFSEKNQNLKNISSLSPNQRVSVFTAVYNRCSVKNESTYSAYSGGFL